MPEHTTKRSHYLHRVDDKVDITVYLQAVHNVLDQTNILYWEFLTRVYDDKGRVSLPSDFFASLSTSDKQSLFRWQIQTALSLMDDKERSDEHISIGINITARDLALFGYDALEEIIGTDRCTLNGRLLLEILEYDCSDDDMAIVRERQPLFDNVGISLALDDLGTQMANFDFLNEYADLFEIVKVSGSFFSQCRQDAMYHDILSAIVKMLRAKGKTIVVEHIERIEDIERVNMLDVSYGQGFYLSRPTSIENSMILKNEQNISDISPQNRKYS